MPWSVKQPNPRKLNPRQLKLVVPIQFKGPSRNCAARYAVRKQALWTVRDRQSAREIDNDSNRTDEETQELFLAMSDFGSHASFLATNFSSTFSGLFRSHSDKLPVEVG
jgi:hypothetical protein